MASEANGNGFADLPKGWEVVRLGDVATLKSGGTPSKKRDDFWNGTIPWASPKDIKTPWLADTIDHISEEGLEDGSRLAPAGSIFVVIRGMILARDLPVAMATVPMAFNQDMKAVVPTGEAEGDYLLHAFTRFKQYLIPEIGTSAHGTRRLGTSAIEEFRFPLPPREEQRAIAAVLRTVQRAREATERVIAAARELKQSLLRHLFTYGPVPVHKADQVELQETDYGTCPAGWERSVLSEHAEIQTGVAKGRKLNGSETVSLPYLRVANVQDGYLDLAEMKELEIRASEVERYSLRPGDVVLTEGGDFDKLGRGFVWSGEIPNCIHQNHVFAVRPDSTLNSEYLAYLTQGSYGKAYFLAVAHKTTNLACINKTKLSAFPALVPPMSEQLRIVETMQAVDEKIAAEESRCSALKVLFSTLLHDLMTGRVRVHEFPL